MHRADLAQLLQTHADMSRALEGRLWCWRHDAARRAQEITRAAILAELRSLACPVTVSLPGRRVELVLNRTGDGWVERAVGDGLRVYRQKERV